MPGPGATFRVADIYSLKASPVYTTHRSSHSQKPYVVSTSPITQVGKQRSRGAKGPPELHTYHTAGELWTLHSGWASGLEYPALSPSVNLGKACPRRDGGIHSYLRVTRWWHTGPTRSM